ncbi:MAG: 30S ribosomal protein S4 [Chloroflexi bacterium]|nr:30S ribosomal protein S4 [Chloroflexota bacterium]
MARYTGPKCRKCRRFQAALCGKANCAITKKNLPPGPRPVRRRKISDAGQQLIEKQKVRFAYGLMEKQFRGIYDKASRMPGETGLNLMSLLELRLDNIVYRLGLASTRSQARQLVTHGLVSVDGKKMSVPSARLKIGQKISFTERGKRSKYCEILREEIAGRDVKGWLSLDRDNLTGELLSLPGAGDWESIFNPTAIVERYSR